MGGRATHQVVKSLRNWARENATKAETRGRLEARDEVEEGGVLDDDATSAAVNTSFIFSLPFLFFLYYDDDDFARPAGGVRSIGVRLPVAPFSLLAIPQPTRSRPLSPVPFSVISLSALTSAWLGLLHPRVLPRVTYRCPPNPRPGLCRFAAHLFRWKEQRIPEAVRFYFFIYFFSAFKIPLADFFF